MIEILVTYIRETACDINGSDQVSVRPNPMYMEIFMRTAAYDHCFLTLITVQLDKDYHLLFLGLQ